MLVHVTCYAQRATSFACRDTQAISAVKAAISKPKTRGYPLIECEFPPLKELNKLGDGSMRSANEVDQVRHVARLQYFALLFAAANVYELTNQIQRCA